MPLNDIRPGELITAQFINDLIAELRELEGRVARLEAGSGQVVITDIRPSRTVNALTDLFVDGRNFEVPSRFNEVLLGSVPATEFKEGSSTNLLIFTIPNMGDTAVTVPLIIRNQFGEARDTLVIQPPGDPTLSGEVTILPRFEGLGEITVGETFIYWFSITSNTNLDETYNFGFNYVNPVGSATIAEWEAQTEIVTTDMSPDAPEFPPTTGITTITQRELTRLQATAVGVRMTIPDGAISVMMSLSVASTTNPTDPQLNRSSNLVDIVVGEVTAGGDLDIDFEILVAGAGSFDTATNTINLPVGATVPVQITAEFRADTAGNYTAQIQYDPDSAGWPAPNPPSFTFNGVLDGQQREFAFTLNAALAGEQFLLVRLVRNDGEEAFRRYRTVGS